MARPLKMNPVLEEEVIVRYKPGKLTDQDVEKLWQWLLQRRAKRLGLKPRALDRGAQYREKFTSCLSEAVAAQTQIGLILELGWAYKAATGIWPATSSTPSKDDRSGLFVEFVQRVVGRGKRAARMPSGTAIRGTIGRILAENKLVWAEASDHTSGSTPGAERSTDRLLQEISDLLGDFGSADHATDEMARTLGVSVRTLNHWLRTAASLSDVLVSGIDDLLRALVLAIRAIFEAQGGEKLSSETIIQQLAMMPDRPWASWRQNRPLGQRELAGLLAPLGIKPIQSTIEGRVRRGYRRSDFHGE